LFQGRKEGEGKIRFVFKTPHMHGAMPWREKEIYNILFMKPWEQNYCDSTSPADAPPYLKATSANTIFKFKTIFFYI
jgi:hypothetical protein